MKIKKVLVGSLQCNCYLLEKEGKALIIDPGDELNKILEVVGDCEIVGILLTHHHFDHVGCVEDLVNRYRVPVFDCHQLKEGKHSVFDFCFEVIYTFGHTMDSVTYYFEDDKVMFTGDFLFYGTIGRCDFEESDYQEMLMSIDKIKKYSDDIIVYPGHGRDTTLGREKKFNPYFQ